MNGELLPGVVAAAGGGVMLAVIVAGEARKTARMRAGRVPYGLTFPLGTDSAAALRALEALAGLAEAFELVAEIASDGEQISHRLYLPEEVAASIGAQLRAAVPGLRLVPDESQPLRPSFCLTVRVPQRAILRSSDPEGASRALLAALLPLERDEAIAVRWALRPGQPADDSELSALPSETERHHERAWRSKLAGPGLFVTGVIVVRAGEGRRARALAQRVVAVLRSRRAGRNALLIRHRLVGTSPWPRASRRSGWCSLPELLPCLGLPLLGAEAVAGVELGAARQIAPRRELAHQGRPLFVADRHGQPRQVAIGPEAATRHAAWARAGAGSRRCLHGASARISAPATAVS